MKRFLRYTFAVALSTLATGCAPSDSDLPREPPVSVLSAPLWTVGEAEEPTALFQSIRSLAVSPDGVVAIADLGGRVALFDSLGNWVREVGRRGEGPGEYLQPTWVHFSGDSIFVWDVQLRRLSLFSLSGEFRSSRPVVQIGTGLRIRAHGAGLVAEMESGQTVDPDPALGFVLHVIPGGSGADTLLGPYPIPEYGWKIVDERTQNGVLVQPPVFSIRPPWDVCDGMLVWADPLGDSLVVKALGQDTRDVIHLESGTESVSERDKELYLIALQDQWGLDEETMSGIREGTIFASARPEVTEVVCGPNEEIWVSDFDPAVLDPSSGVGSSWRALDRSGRLLRIMSFPQGFLLRAVAGDTAYGVSRTEHGVEYVSAYLIPPPGRVSS